MRSQTLPSGILIACLPFIQASVAVDETEILARQSVVETFTSTSGAAIADLLAGTHVSGGIISVYGRCSSPIEYQFTFGGGTLKQELDYISSIDTSRKWIYRDGAILVGSDIVSRTILNAVIKDIDLKSIDALSLSTQRLLESPEVRDRANAVGLDEAITQGLGFYALPTPGTPTGRPSAPTSKHLHQVTLADALDEVATMKGMSVWHYEQFECSGKPTYRIVWVVR